MSTQMIVRIDPQLKKKVSEFAMLEGKSASEVVRELLTDYVKNRDIGAYIDGLWDRIGGQLASNGVGPGEIQRAIRAARARD